MDKPLASPGHAPVLFVLPEGANGTNRPTAQVLASTPRVAGTDLDLRIDGRNRRTRDPILGSASGPDRSRRSVSGSTVAIERTEVPSGTFVCPAPSPPAGAPRPLPRRRSAGTARTSSGRPASSIAAAMICTLCPGPDSSRTSRAERCRARPRDVPTRRRPAGRRGGSVACGNAVDNAAPPAPRFRQLVDKSMARAVGGRVVLILPEGASEPERRRRCLHQRRRNRAGGSFGRFVVRRATR